MKRDLYFFMLYSLFFHDYKTPSTQLLTPNRGRNLLKKADILVSVHGYLK